MTRQYGARGDAVAETKTKTDAKPPQPVTGSPARRAGYRLLRRLLIYHVAVAITLAIVFSLFPSLPDYLPIGGLRDLAGSSDISLGQADGPEPAADAGAAESGPASLDRLGYARQLAIALVGVWVLMLPVSWVHKGIYRSSGFDHSLDETTLILPGVVTAIVLVVQYSLALAFALAGIVAGVHFRRALQDTFDALFILAAIGTGIAAGVGALEVAAVMSVFFCYATVYVCCFGDGLLQSDFLAARKREKRRLKEAAARAADDRPSDSNPPGR